MNAVGIVRMNTTQFLIILACWACTIFHGQAQSLFFRQYSTEQGLPGSEVFHVGQDNRGYIWLATRRGISRFDGYEFKNFACEDGECENSVVELRTDQQNTLWFRNESGTWCGMDSSGYFRPAWARKWMAEERGNITTWSQKDSVLIMGAIGPIPLFTSQSGQSLQPMELGELGKNNALTILDSDSGALVWGVKKVNPNQALDLIVIRKQGNFTVKLDHHMGNRAETRPSCIRLKRGGLAIHWGKVLYKIAENGQMDSLHVGTHHPGSLTEDKIGNLWTGLMQEGVRFFPNGELNRQSMTTYLEGLSVSSILADRERCLWFATRENGVFFLASKAFRTITRQDGLGSEQIIGLSTNGQKIGFATALGGVFSLAKGQNPELNPETFEEEINDLLVHPDGSLWIGTENGLFHFKESATRINHRDFQALHCTPPGKVLAGTHTSLLVFSPQGEALDSFELPSPITAIGTGPRGAILVGTVRGLWALNKGRIIFLGQQFPWLKTHITAIDKFRDHHLVTTLGAGVIQVWPDSARQINVDFGLVSNLCNDLVVDTADRVWVATNAGLNALEFPNPNNRLGRVEVFSTNDGLASNEVHKVEAFDGKVWAATNRGLSFFDHEVAVSSVEPPLVYVNSVKVNNEDLGLKQHYRLTHNENNLIINFVGLSLRDAGELEYMIKMEGKDMTGEWRSLTGRSVQFNPLQPGSYTFHLDARNKMGQRAANPVEITFSVSSPYWQTWWFLSTVILSIISILWSIFYIRLIMIKRQTLLLKKAFESEQKALRSQMTPHFIFNSLNSIQLLVASNNRIDALKNLSKFSKLMRKILQNSKKTTVPLIEELETLELYVELENLRFDNRIYYSLNIEEDIDQEMVEIPPMLIQPYVENAIWHGLMNREEMGGRVDINIREKENMLTCSIQDNGVGRKKAMELSGKNGTHQSSGMQITKERLMILNATKHSRMSVRITDLANARGEAQGTKVEIFIPV